MEEVTQSASIAITSEDTGSEVKGVDATEITKNEEGEGFAEEEDVGNLELSSELQQLVQRLEEKTESWSITVDSGGRDADTTIEYRVFDAAQKSYIPTGRCRVLLGAQAKLRLLQAIGSCTTLREIAVKNLTGNELETLLIPMQSDPIMEKIQISFFSFAAAETAFAAKYYAQRTFEILGRILQTSRTFKVLQLHPERLTAAGARHLASGVRGNAESALEVFHIGRWEESSVANQIAEIVQSAPRLRELVVDEGGVVDEDGIDALASALAQSTSLHRLTLRGVVGASALLLKALIGDRSNKSIVSLRLINATEGIGDFLPLLLSGNQSLKRLECSLAWRVESLSLSQWRRVGQSLRFNSSLEHFRMGVTWSSFRGEAIDGGETLLSALDMKNSFVGLYLDYYFVSYSDWTEEGTEELLREMNKKNPIIELQVNVRFIDLTTMWANLAEALYNQGTQLSSLYLHMGPWLEEAKGGEGDNFLQALRETRTLRILTVEEGKDAYWPGGWTKLIDCLHSNTSITHLRLIDCDGLDEDVFKQFMGVLQVNLTLKSIRLDGTAWETDGKKALVEEALRRNAVQDSYFSTFRRYGLKLQPATSGRLFLCGPPLAGKTKLRQTMTRILRGNTWVGDKLAQLWRTQGVEVELLKDDDEMQITVWDLAGQLIFRTLQNILFPQTNHNSIFLFVFSPYDRENCRIRESLDQCFKTELEEWLRFIASNSQITGRMLPRVLVVISHIDKMQGHEFWWAKSIVKELGEEFRNILDVCGTLYEVNACSKRQVTPLKDFILETFRDLLRNNTPIAPRVCAQISSILANREKDIKHRPLWSSQEFYRFCSENLQDDTSEFLKLEITSREEVFKAMASFLHDTGSIIVIASLDKIIVDPNWLTNVFLGELITIGHSFRVNSKEVQNSKINLFSKTGLVSSSDLELLLSSFMKKQLKCTELNSSLLKNLMIYFDLCYKVEGEDACAKYFMPTIVCEDPSSRDLDTSWKTVTENNSLSWSSPSERNQQFIGFRIECENPRRMSMSAALYPRFQIYMRHKLMAEMNLTADIVTCSRNYMHLHMDGHEIFVERGAMAKSHIDILVKCSKHKCRESTMDYIEKHIIEELSTFCASPRGCPGITLVVGVLQTKCVEKLVPLAFRGSSQAILIRRLKDNFETHIRMHKEEMKSGTSSSLLNYEHCWPAIPDFLSSSFELAKELLKESDVESITKNVLESYVQDVKLLNRALEEMTDRTEQAQCVSKVVAEDGTWSLVSEVTNPCSSSTGTSSSYISQQTIGQVLSRIDRLDHNIVQRFDGLEVTLKRIERSIERNMDTIVSLQHELQSSLSLFMSKLDTMIGYAESEERSRTPKRPYLSFDDMNVFHKVIAKIHLGKAVRLHLMCESVVGPHIVKDQPGLQLCIEKENMEWLRRISDISFQMMYYLVKAGLHVITGLGQAVPDLSSLEAALPLSVATVAVDNIAIDGNSISVEQNGNMTSEQAWIRLRNVLASKLENNYTGLFKLYRVKYLNLKEGGYVWVCDPCMTKGVRNKSLEPL